MWEPDYATIEQLREYARINDADDTVDDDRMARDITAASRAVDEHCHRQFGKTDTPEARVFTAQGYTPRWQRTIVAVDDVMTAVGAVVTVGGTAVTPARWTPSNAPSKGKPWSRIELPGRLSLDPDAIEITATWGWTAVPTAVTQATLLQALRLSKRPDSPFGVAGSPDLGNELRLLSKVDPDVAVMLRRYVRRGAVA